MEDTQATTVRRRLEFVLKIRKSTLYIYENSVAGHRQECESLDAVDDSNEAFSEILYHVAGHYVTKRKQLECKIQGCVHHWMLKRHIFYSWNRNKRSGGGSGVRQR